MTTDKIVLQKNISKQLGLHMERQMHWAAAVDYLNKANEYCQKVQDINNTEGGAISVTNEIANMDIEIIENMMTVCKCYCRMKNIDWAQRLIQDITFKSQTIVDFCEEQTE